MLRPNSGRPRLLLHRDRYTPCFAKPTRRFIIIGIRDLFDGRKIKLLENVAVKEPQEVIITFLGDNEDEALCRGIYRLAERGGSFNFLNAPEEDIYSDDDLKVRYKND